MIHLTFIDPPKTYTQDGVCLTESGMSQLQSLTVTVPRRKRTKPKLKLKIINQNSVAVLQTPPDAQSEHSRDGEMDDSRGSDLLLACLVSLSVTLHVYVAYIERSIWYTDICVSCAECTVGAARTIEPWLIVAHFRDFFLSSFCLCHPYHGKHFAKAHSTGNMNCLFIYPLDYLGKCCSFSAQLYFEESTVQAPFESGNVGSAKRCLDYCRACIWNQGGRRIKKVLLEYSIFSERNEVGWAESLRGKILPCMCTDEVNFLSVLVSEVDLKTEFRFGSESWGVAVVQVSHSVCRALPSGVSRIGNPEFSVEEC